MTYFFISYLIGGLSLACLIVALFFSVRMHIRLADMELKQLADLIELQTSIKQQIVGAVDYHFRNNSRCFHKNNLPAKKQS